MHVSPEAVSVVEKWMSKEFPGAQVESGEIFDRDVVLFRASDGSSSYELEVTEEAFLNHPVETIIGDLRDQGVARRLQKDSTLRLCYYSRREVPHFETRYVRCDGETYRIVRDAEHNVRIFDSLDRLLERTPPGLRVMRGSVFRRQQEEWCREIRSHRGEQ